MKSDGDGFVVAGEIDGNGAISLGSETEWADDTDAIVFFDVAFDLEGSAGEESFVITWRKEDSSSDNHHAFSIVGTVDDSDLSVSLGTAAEIGTNDLAGQYISVTDMAGDNRVLFCYCLLYTSPSPRDLG